MASIPPRDSRVLQTVDRLQQEILSGAIQGDLPGERALATRLRVGRVTLRAALKLLEDKQWVTPSKPGCRRKTIDKGKYKKTAVSTGSGCQGKVIVTLAPHALTDLPTNERLDHARLNSLCSSAGITVRHRALDLSQVKRPAHRLNEFIKQNPADLYLLQLTSQETQQWFHQQDLPCIVLGSVWPGCELSCVDYDQRALGLHAATTLARLGHRKVGMLYPLPEKRGLQLFLEGFSVAAVEVEITLAHQDDTPESVIKALLSLVSDPEQRNTAIILPRIPYAITATSMLPEAGVQVPRDISLLCLVHDDVLHFSYPQVAGYSTHTDAFPKAMFDLIVKKLLHPASRLAETSLVMPEFITAGSLTALS